MVTRKSLDGRISLRISEHSLKAQMKSVWSLVGYVKANRSRTIVMMLLAENIMIPRDIARKTGLRLTHVSRALKGLVADSLVECVSPGNTVGRIYRTTKTGKEVADKLKKVYSEESEYSYGKHSYIKQKAQIPRAGYTI